MKIENLIGKTAIRTAPNKKGDRSYMTDPRMITDADETHIYTKEGPTEKEWILAADIWNDGNWKEFKRQKCHHTFSKIVGFASCYRCGSKIVRHP